MFERPNFPSACRAHTWQTLRNSLQSGMRRVSSSTSADGLGSCFGACAVAKEFKAPTRTMTPHNLASFIRIAPSDVGARDRSQGASVHSRAAFLSGWSDDDASSADLETPHRPSLGATSCCRAKLGAARATSPRRIRCAAHRAWRSCAPCRHQLAFFARFFFGSSSTAARLLAGFAGLALPPLGPTGPLASEGLLRKTNAPPCRYTVVQSRAGRQVRNIPTVDN
jgi:hypothetical protein